MIYQFSIQQGDKKTLGRFRDALIKHNYTYDHFQKIDINPFTFSQFDLPILAYRFPAILPFGVLFHLFFLGAKLDGRIVRKIFADDEIEKLLKIKILEKVGDYHLQSAIIITPYQRYYFVADFLFHLGSRKESDKPKYEYVYPANLDSITLCEAMIKKSINTALDLGCGCGILSLFASQFSKNVTGVDLNPRAVNFSQFNAILNGIDNCQFLDGDLYESIAGEKYDLILSNPPYELTTKKTYLYKDGGKYGDKILKRIISGASSHLRKGGLCQVVTRIAQFGDKKRQDMIREWTTDNLYIFFINLQQMDIYRYAQLLCIENLISQDKILDYQKYSRNVKEFLDYFHKINLSYVTLGILNLAQNKTFKYEEQNFSGKNIPPSEIENIIYQRFNIIEKVWKFFLSFQKWY